MSKTNGSKNTLTFFQNEFVVAVRNAKLCLRSTQILVLAFGQKHTDCKATLCVVQTSVEKHLPIGGNSPLIMMASSTQGAQRAGAHAKSVVPGNSGIPKSLILDILIMFLFCDAILIELKFQISKDKNHYICCQIRCFPDPNTGSMGVCSTTFIVSEWPGLLDSQGVVGEPTGERSHCALSLGASMTPALSEKGEITRNQVVGRKEPKN